MDSRTDDMAPEYEKEIYLEQTFEVLFKTLSILLP